MSNPRISVVTPAFNEAEHIRETLESVSVQDYPNVEHIIIDDGSTDQTPSILAEFSSNHELRVVRTENRVQSAALNTGFEQATGDYVAWVNGDDILFTRTALSRVVEAFEADEDVDLVYGMHALIDGEGTFRGLHVPVPWFDINRLKRWCFGAFVFMRRDVARTYSLDTNYNYALDYEMFLRAATNGCEFAYVPNTLLGYRTHNATKSVQGAEDMHDESQVIKQRYGVKIGLSHYLHRVFDKVLLTGLRFYGLLTILTLLQHKKKLTTEDAMGSWLSCLVAQLQRISPTTTH